MPCFAERLRQQRLAVGLTQEQLGFAVDVSKSSVSAWENGRETPSFRVLPLLKEALGCSLDGLIASSYEPVADDLLDSIGEEASPSQRARDHNELRLLSVYRRMSRHQRKALLEVLGPWEEQREGRYSGKIG